MAKELPYFKFEPNKYLTGDITLCSFTAQGIFINLCSHYWSKDCSMSLAIAKQRFSNNTEEFNQLVDFGIIKVLNDDSICIDFLDEQMEKFIELSDIRANSGRKGGKSKANAKQIKANANIEEKRREEKSTYKTPTVEDVIDYFLSNQYTKESAIKAFNYYEAGNWHDVNGKKVKNWKQKMQANWFKPENKNVKKYQQY